MQELQALEPPLTQSSAEAAASAIGVELNRLHNIVITLDKAKYVLSQPGQSREPLLALLSDEEVAAHLWNGERSIARRCVKAAAAVLLGDEVRRPPAPPPLLSPPCSHLHPPPLSHTHLCVQHTRQSIAAPNAYARWTLHTTFTRRVLRQLPVQILPVRLRLQQPQCSGTCLCWHRCSA